MDLTYLRSVATIIKARPPTHLKDTLRYILSVNSMSDERSEERVEFTVNLVEITRQTQHTTSTIILRSFAELRSSGAKRSLRAPQRGSELAKSRARSEPRARPNFAFSSIWLAEAERSDCLPISFQSSCSSANGQDLRSKSDSDEGRLAARWSKKLSDCCLMRMSHVCEAISNYSAESEK